MKPIRECAVQAFGAPILVDAWEPDARADYTWAVVEATDPAVAGTGPLQGI